MSGLMSEKLLNTLSAIDARDQTTAAASKSAMGFLENGQQFDKDTGEIVDAPPAYEPLKPAEVKVQPLDTKVPDMSDSDALIDYRRVRDTTYAIQEASLFMMTEISKLAASTENPRVYSIFKELGELVRGCNKDLIENQKSIASSKASNDPKINDDVSVEATINEDGSVAVKTTKRNSANLLKEIERQRAKMEAEEKERLAKAALELQNNMTKTEEPIQDAEFTEVEAVTES